MGSDPLLDLYHTNRGGIMNRLKSIFPRLKDLIVRGIEIYQKNNMTVYSGNATLFIVTAVFPFIMLIISIVNLLPGYSTKDVADVLFQILPDLDPIKDLVESMITNLKNQSGGLLASAAAVTTLWSASRGVFAIQKGLDQLDWKEPESLNDTELDKEQEIKEIKKKGKGAARSILKQLIFTLMLVILIPALLVFEMLGDSISGIIDSIVEKLGSESLTSTLSKIDSFFHTSSLVVIVFSILVILQIYAILPEKHRTLKSQLPGALLTGVGWFVFTKLFSFFIPRFYHASSLYGSLASLFLVLLWLRFVVMILFAGGVANRALEEEQQQATKK